MAHNLIIEIIFPKVHTIGMSVAAIEGGISITAIEGEGCTEFDIEEKNPFYQGGLRTITLSHRRGEYDRDLPALPRTKFAPNISRVETQCFSVPNWGEVVFLKSYGSNKGDRDNDFEIIEGPFRPQDEQP